MMNLVEFMNVMDLLKLSMTSKALLNFVDSYCMPMFREEIRQSMRTVFIDTIPYSVTSNVSQNGTPFFKATVNMGSMKQRLQTLPVFHLIEGLVIPFSMRFVHAGKTYMFEHFEIMTVCSSKHKCNAVQKWENVREYTLYLKSTKTRMNVPYPHPHPLWHLPRFMYVSEPTLKLKVENVAVVMDNARTYFVRDCLSMCGMCNIKRASFVTYDRLSDETRRRICKKCQMNKFEKLGNLKQYRKRFGPNWHGVILKRIIAAKEVQKMQIDYVNMSSKHKRVSKLLHTDDVAKFAGFSDWKKMTSSWEGWGQGND